MSKFEGTHLQYYQALMTYRQGHFLYRRSTTLPEMSEQPPLKSPEKKNDVIQLEVLAKGIISTHDDVKSTSVWLLQERSDHKAMDIIIEGLKDPNPTFREEINETLNFLINREFGSYDEAKIWWEQNKNKYDEDLFEKDGMYGTLCGG